MISYNSDYSLLLFAWTIIMLRSQLRITSYISICILKVKENNYSMAVSSLRFSKKLNNHRMYALMEGTWLRHCHHVVLNLTLQAKILSKFVQDFYSVYKECPISRCCLIKHFWCAIYRITLISPTNNFFLVYFNKHSVESCVLLG